MLAARRLSLRSLRLTFVVGLRLTFVVGLLVLEAVLHRGVSIFFTIVRLASDTFRSSWLMVWVQLVK